MDARNPKTHTKTTARHNRATATPTMEDVTASFAASLALATNEVVDLSRSANSAARRGSQAYLLAWPLTTKPAPLQDLRRFFRCVWVLEKDFKIQERPENRFVIAFDLKRDSNKVLRGGLGASIKLRLSYRNMTGLHRHTW
ncbi:hypothetical protein RchiOBHm_Chr7g0243191 [Rosa chinensis]|uniref:Uncharacterized protein n=1 Tax=Rosa chinensis TaxID=74649 RepID=A0A2P6PIP1_ROSCH|nr:hypothetical protein RchiOBHm_Chr7g0243191 [Rosa chinensis]